MIVNFNLKVQILYIFKVKYCFGNGLLKNLK